MAIKIMTYQEMAQVMPFKDLVTKNAAELIKLYGGDRKKVLQHCALLRTMSVYLMNEGNQNDSQNPGRHNELHSFQNTGAPNPVRLN